MSNSVCFIPTGPIEWASARLRAYWVAEHMENAFVAPFANAEIRIPNVDAYVWHKRFSPDFIRDTKAQGKRHYWDICDPLWWFSPKESQALLDLVDGVVCATPALADDFYSWSGIKAHVIPDHIKVEHYDVEREHSETWPIRFIWYGMAANRVSIAGAWANLSRLAANGYDISLTIFDDMPGKPLGYGDEIPVYYAKWDLQHEAAILVQHDIALLPLYPGPWGKMKSDNKMLTAWAAGLPFTDGFNYDEMVGLVADTAYRMAKAIDGFKAVRFRDSCYAADMWREYLE